MVGQHGADKPSAHRKSRKGRDHTSAWEVPARFANPSPIVHTRNAGLLLYATAFLWFHKIADFRQSESALVYRKRPNTEIRCQHRRILEVLIQEGKELMRRIRAHGGMISAENGFSTKDIQSQVPFFSSSVASSISTYYDPA